jgi:hypothetical protein
MSMGWFVWNWGERWGTSGLGRSDRWGALCYPNGVVISDFLEGHWAAAGPTGDEFGTTGFGARTGPAEKASPTVGTPVLGGALAQRLKMALVNKTPTPLSGGWLTMPTRGGWGVIK